MIGAGFAGRRVLVTGHTGFKGAWLTAWLADAGAHVTGYSLAPETDPNLWELLRLDGVSSHIGDLNDRAALDAAIAECQPEIVFHLAAQALVRRSYREPVETFASNVLGTVQILDALRGQDGLKSVIVATSDKAYENVEQVWGYRETDRMGGRDPYSASKGATELAAASMRASFFGPDQPVRVATVRAGNVIGGGDWAEDRLVPDIVRGCLGADGSVTLRQPFSIRPWQHVLEPLSGYMQLALAQIDRPDFADGWNFGPDRAEERPVADVARAVVDALGAGDIIHDPAAADLHEAKLLRLDVSKARAELGWRPRMSFEQTISLTADWYGRWSRGEDAGALCREQISFFETLSESQS